jgi:hypothetical protein
LSIVMARLCSLKAAVEEQDGHGLDTDDVQGSIDNMGGEDRWRFSLDSLTRQTGLTRETVVAAKRLLNHRCGIVELTTDEPVPGRGTPADMLIPRWDFRAVVTPAAEGYVRVAFDRGSENGQ